MDGVHVGDLGRADDAAHLQVALRAGGGTDADGLISEVDVHGVGVCLGVNSDGFDVKFLASTDDPEGNFASVSDQYFFEHEGDGADLDG